MVSILISSWKDKKLSFDKKCKEFKRFYEESLKKINAKYVVWLKAQSGTEDISCPDELLLR